MIRFYAVSGGLPTPDLAVFNSGSIGSFAPNQLLLADWDQIATVLRWIRMHSTIIDEQPPWAVHRMAPNELNEVVDVDYRSLIGSLDFYDRNSCVARKNT